MPRSGPDTTFITPFRFRRGARPLAGLIGAVALSSLGACDPIKTVASKVAGPFAAGPDYLAPPTPTGARLLADGRIGIQGAAPAGAKVSLRSPEGETAEAYASSESRWSLNLPLSNTPRLYAFDALLDGRTLRAEGALCVLPGGEVLVLRAGSGAAVLGAAGGLSLADVDFDGGGGVAVSGLSGARAPVRLTIDGVAAGLAQADVRGRFVVIGLDPRRAPLSGIHTIGVQTPTGLAAAAKISLAASAPMADTQIYRASAVEGGWRIDWRLPGGGTQTAVVFSPPVQGAPLVPGAQT